MSFSINAARHGRRALLGLVAALALVACGGGTSQYDPFDPQRMFAFGDENSVLTPAGAQPVDPVLQPGVVGADGPPGRRYGVNAYRTIAASDTTPAQEVFDCTLNPVWVQTVASAFGFVFAECNPNNVAAPQAFMHAAVGTKVQDVAAQIAAARPAGGFNSRDLALVMAGSNDVLELYRQVVDGTLNADEAVAEAGRRGRDLAGQVNQLVAEGARVILAWVPDLGLSPYARAQELLRPGAAALLTRLTTELNEQSGVNLPDGRYVGLVQTDQMVQALVDSPDSYGLSNVSNAVCTVALPDCYTDTLVTGGSASGYLWADGTRMAYGGQGRLGSLARDRATENPF